MSTSGRTWPAGSRRAPSRPATTSWSTSGAGAEVGVVWAGTGDGLRGFVVPTTTGGCRADPIGHKLSMRAWVTSELVLDGGRLPADAVLPGVRGLRGPLSCLTEA